LSSHSSADPSPLKVLGTQEYLSETPYIQSVSHRSFRFHGLFCTPCRYEKKQERKREEGKKRGKEREKRKRAKKEGRGG
jgi:hypothetical protein